MTRQTHYQKARRLLYFSLLKQMESNWLNCEVHSTQFSGKASMHIAQSNGLKALSRRLASSTFSRQTTGDSNLAIKILLSGWQNRKRTSTSQLWMFVGWETGTRFDSKADSSKFKTLSNPTSRQCGQSHFIPLRFMKARTEFSSHYTKRTTELSMSASAVLISILASLCLEGPLTALSSWTWKTSYTCVRSSWKFACLQDST